MREAYAAERKTLFVVGSYHIGKERAFFGAARALGFKIWCHAAKKKVGAGDLHIALSSWRLCWVLCHITLEGTGLKDGDNKMVNCQTNRFSAFALKLVTASTFLMQRQAICTHNM